jgi:dipeptidyl aminopeptidase/acylaminoacyl peptidase
MIRRPIAAVVLFALIARVAIPAEPTHEIAPEDYFSLGFMSELAVSPDGKQVVFCWGTWDTSDDTRKSDLWIVATDGQQQTRRLTFDRANDRRPQWSADGRSIYFLGNRQRGDEKKPPYDGSTQVWQVDAAGGEPKPITRESDLADYDLAAEAIYLHTVVEHRDDDSFSKLRSEYGKVEYGHGKRKISEIHRLDLATWHSEKLIDPQRYVREFAVTDDGQRIAMLTAFDDSVLKSEGESRLDIWQDGKIITPPTDVYRAKAPSPWAWLENLAWNADGSRLAFCAVFDAYPAEVVLIEYKQDDWVVSFMPRGQQKKLHVRGYGTPLWWEGADKLFGLCEAKGSVGFFTYDAAGSQWTPSIEPGAVIHLMASAPGNRAVALRSSGRFAELQRLDDGKPAATLTDLNRHTNNWKIPTVEHVSWKAPDGAEVGGPLELPYGYQKAKQRLPLVVAIHGGPTTASYLDPRFDPHNGRTYFSAKGYAVLAPNYRGSTGYGDEFVTDLIGHENDIEVKDILSGIEYLVKQGIADPKRIAVMGWSNGGYLTNCLITLKYSPVKISAASSGAGILDSVAEWGFNDEPAFPRVFNTGLPWEKPEVYHKSSPTYGLANVTTPTLIHVGGEDVRCPPGHSRMLYRALKHYVDVPTELIVYPGEPHGLTKKANRQAKMEWDLAWFEEYLQAEEKKGNKE